LFVHRLDGIDVRLDAIEQCLKESDDNIGQQMPTDDDDTSKLVESFGCSCSCPIGLDGGALFN